MADKLERLPAALWDPKNLQLRQQLEALELLAPNRKAFPGTAFEAYRKWRASPTREPSSADESLVRAP